jgi:hypothetical protein
MPAVGAHPTRQELRIYGLKSGKMLGATTATVVRVVGLCRNEYHPGPQSLVPDYSHVDGAIAAIAQGPLS